MKERKDFKTQKEYETYLKKAKAGRASQEKQKQDRNYRKNQREKSKGFWDSPEGMDRREDLAERMSK